MIGRKRDNIARALRAIGYYEAYSGDLIGNSATTAIELHKIKRVADNHQVIVAVCIGQAGKVTISIPNKPEYKLAAAAVAALVSAGEYVFLCGSLSASEKARIIGLVP